VTGPTDAIELDETVTTRVDREVDSGSSSAGGCGASRSATPVDHVCGYTVGNDVSARDIQSSESQWVRGKSFDTFCPLGPVVVTADELDGPQRLRLRTLVNGEVMQDSSTAEMVFGVAELLWFCSRAFTLEPGDVVLRGTPWGCGEFMDPPRSLAPGDVVMSEIEGIGALHNPVMAVPPA